MDKPARPVRKKTPQEPRAWQRMLSGRRLNLVDPSPLDVEIEDIAHGLARVARWNGQTSGGRSYSVAQHSLLVEAIAGLLSPSLSAGTRLAVLLHDAAEYVIGDLVSPLKAAIGAPYRDVESRILDAVMQRFDLPAPMTRIAYNLAKKADLIAAFHEATHLAGFSIEDAHETFGRPPALGSSFLPLLTPWNAEDAQARFLLRFRELAESRPRKV